MMKKNYAILGPTASGKTKAAIEIFKILSKNNKFFPIVNCDSRQFWPIEVITASPTKEEKKYPHLFFNHMPGDFSPSLGWWIQEIQTIPNKIIVGGNGFYISNLQKGVPIVEISQKTKEKVTFIENKYDFLKKNINVSFSSSDTYRTHRYLEFFLETGMSYESFPHKYQEDLEIFAIIPDKNIIEKRIEQRTSSIIHDAIEEISVKTFHQNYRSIIGYMEICNFLQQNHSSLQTLLDSINLQTFQYAKRQTKFLKTIKDIKIFRSSEELVNHFIQTI